LADLVRSELEAVFRAKRAPLIAALTRAFGPRNLEIVENALQDACAEAAYAWRVSGVPQKPDAWLLTVARNRVLDQLRRRARAQRNAGALEAAELARGDDVEAESEVRLAAELPDDQLQMMFVACHPCNTIESQIALTLRTLCGMEIDEIARALLSEPSAIAKRLVRARESVRRARVEFDLPERSALPERLPAVLKVIYLLFNEGYSASRGERPIRHELCREAMRIGELLAEHERTASPKVHALLALMLLQASRLEARTDELGALLTLAEQDRSKWDHVAIERGLQHLARSASGEDVSEYHMEAAIAACHATARTFAETDWERVIGCYDTLLALFPAPIPAFNRAVAIGFGRGAEEGLRALEELSEERTLASYFPYHAALGEFLARVGRREEASSQLNRALTLAGTDAERAFVRKRIGEVAG